MPYKIFVLGNVETIFLSIEKTHVAWRFDKMKYSFCFGVSFHVSTGIDTFEPRICETFSQKKVW